MLSLGCLKAFLEDHWAPRIRCEDISWVWFRWGWIARKVLGKSSLTAKLPSFRFFLLSFRPTSSLFFPFSPSFSFTTLCFPQLSTPPLSPITSSFTSPPYSYFFYLFSFISSSFSPHFPSFSSFPDLSQHLHQQTKCPWSSESELVTE